MTWEQRVKGVKDAQILVYEIFTDTICLGPVGRDLLARIYWRLTDSYIAEVVSV